MVIVEVNGCYYSYTLLYRVITCAMYGNRETEIHLCSSHLYICLIVLSLILLFPLEIHSTHRQTNTNNQCGFQHNRSAADYVF
jgi:dolichol kinase